MSMPVVRRVGGCKTFAVDAGMNYLVMGPALRIMLAFQHVDLGNSQISNVVQAGVQASLF